MCGIAWVGCVRACVCVSGREELEIEPGVIVQKVKLVALPFHSDVAHLAEADFWGPLFMVILYALVSVWGQFRVLSWVIMLWVIGAAGLNLLIKLLGGESAFSNVASVVGYSLLPLTLAAFVSALTPSTLGFVVRVVCVVWSALVSTWALATTLPPSKKVLLAYPLVLILVFFSAMQHGA